jgi:hypothetical protein
MVRIEVILKPTSKYFTTENTEEYKIIQDVLSVLCGEGFYLNEER